MPLDLVCPHDDVEIRSGELFGWCRCRLCGGQVELWRGMNGMLERLRKAIERVEAKEIEWLKRSYY